MWRLSRKISGRSGSGGDPNVIGRGITLDGMAHTIVGDLPNSRPVVWSGSERRSLDDKTVQASRIQLRADDARHQFSPRGRAVETWRDDRTGAGGAAVARSKLSRAIPEQDRQLAHNDAQNVAQDVTENLRAGFATLFAAVVFVLLIACSNVANLLLVRFSGRRREIALRMAIGASRGSVVKLFVFESLLVSVFAGAVAGALLAWQLVPLVPRMAANFLPFEPNTRDQSFPSRSRFHDRVVDVDRADDGNLSGAAKIARGSG